MQQLSIAPATVPVIDLVVLRSLQQTRVSLVLVDALPHSYYQSGHLPTALHLPHDTTDALVIATLPDRDASIVTYCASATCPNSHILAARLVKLGYTDVSVFGDGKAAWVTAGGTLAR